MTMNGLNVFYLSDNQLITVFLLSIFVAGNYISNRY